MKKPLVLPKFKTEDEERGYWDTFDITEYFEPTDARRLIFPNLKPTTRPVSLRLPEYMIVRLKERANALDIPYQSLIKQVLHQELFGHGAK